MATGQAKRPNRNLEKALDQGSDYCRMLNAPIVFASDGVYTKTRYISSGLPLFKDGEKIDEFIRESLALKYVTSGHHEIETRDRKVIKSRNDLINVFELANNVLRTELVCKSKFHTFLQIGRSVCETLIYKRGVCVKP